MLTINTDQFRANHSGTAQSAFTDLYGQLIEKKKQLCQVPWSMFVDIHHRAKTHKLRLTNIINENSHGVIATNHYEL